MNDIKNLETLYLQAKIAYYEGNTILKDVEFDALENKLKELNSKVIEQVGSKRSDFDFPHPTKMLSLSKIQTEKVNDITNYQTDLFFKWFNSKVCIIENKISQKISKTQLYYSPKFDGNAINVIYKGNQLSHILTRGDGFTGKNVTDRFEHLVPNDLNSNYKDKDIIEIRCEVVIEINKFNLYYANGFANARNFVAGVIGKDDWDLEKVNNLTIIPLYCIVNGKHIKPNYLIFEKFHNFYKMDYFCEIYDIKNTDYELIMKKMENKRENFLYQLDGIVFSFTEEYREILGENSHDPEWSIAIKFVPEEIVTEVTGIEWNVGKTGELTPTILLKPVELAGTIVKRASGYNAGYIIKNKLGKDSIISIHKSGDIIPELQKIITTTDDIDIPTFCPDCNSELIFDNIHLSCINKGCPGKIVKKLHTAAKSIDIKDVGEETLKKFSYEFDNLYELIIFILDISNHPKGLVEYGFKENSKSLENFINAFKNIKSLSVAQVILLLGYENVGIKLSEQVAKLYYDCDADFKGHDKSLIATFKDKNMEKFIKYCINNLEEFNIKIDKPIKNKKNMKNTIFICMTGSPKPIWDTKSDFISSFNNVEEISITDPKCNYLVTNDLNSVTSKMKNAEKKDVKIVTYEQFKNLNS